MTYTKIDKILFTFFQSMTNVMKKIGIPLNWITNLFLIIMISGQATQLILLYIDKKSVLLTLIVGLPTWLVVLYFYKAIKDSKKGFINLDLIRFMSVSFFFITTGDFIYKYILAKIFQPNYFANNKLYFISEVAYTIAYIAFPCFLYLLSCTNENPQKKIESLKVT